ncbi:hypothetical protein DRW42_17690 [Pedobacter miscanthi]|uniref:Uncharacterized protein n=1 Tax=Pedobacter miscanthi TaxID=2259170 RepID=A0A366KTI3_9SPHI|nr:hypothetical protein DRW42_17690 [Pedobacter miscanthi]
MDFKSTAHEVRITNPDQQPEVAIKTEALISKYIDHLSHLRSSKLMYYYWLIINLAGEIFKTSGVYLYLSNEIS